MYQNHILTKNQITIMLTDGNTLTVPKESGKFNLVKDAIINRKFDEAIEVADAVTFIGKTTKQRFSVKNGKVYVDKQELPAPLDEYLMKLVDKGASCEPLLLFWNNLKHNGLTDVRKRLFGFLIRHKISLTEDGCFLGYKYVRSDFTDVRTGTFDNTPGKRVHERRDLIDTNPENTCAKGLHLGSWDFVKSSGDKIVAVKVNPRNVMCIPNYEDFHKVRVCEYNVLYECERDGGAITDVISTHRTYYYKLTKKQEVFDPALVTSHKPHKFLFTCRGNTIEEATKRFRHVWNQEMA